MEKPAEESPLIYLPFTIPSVPAIEAGLKTLENEFPSIKNRLHPGILKMVEDIGLQGGEIDSQSLLARLLNVYQQFAKGSVSVKRPTRTLDVFVRTVEYLPDHFKILIKDPQILEATLNMHQPEVERIVDKLFEDQTARIARKSATVETPDVEIPESELPRRKRARKKVLGALALRQPTQQQLAKLEAERRERKE